MEYNTLDRKFLMPKIRVAKDALNLAELAADHFVSLSQTTTKNQQQFTVALAGGSTPGGMYSLLATEKYRNRVNWRKIHFFWGDERAVPPEHPDSNYLMVRQALLDPLNILEENIHRIHAEYSPVKAAEEYAQELTSFFNSSTDNPPEFDLLLLGLGEDGHTASLFVGSNAINEEIEWVVADHIFKLNDWRITLTLPLINAGSNIMFLVSGERKAEILKNVLINNQQPEIYPAQLVQPKEGKVIWFADSAAAALLPRSIITE